MQLTNKIKAIIVNATIAIAIFLILFLTIFPNAFAQSADAIDMNLDTSTSIDLQWQYLSSTYVQGQAIQILNNNQSGLSGTTTSVTVRVIQDSDPFEYSVTLYSCATPYTMNASSTFVCSGSSLGTQRAVAGYSLASSTVQVNWVSQDWVTPYAFNSSLYYAIRYSRSNSTGVGLQEYSLGATFGSACYWGYKNSDGNNYLSEDCPNQTSKMSYSINGTQPFNAPYISTSTLDFATTTPQGWTCEVDLLITGLDPCETAYYLFFPQDYQLNNAYIRMSNQFNTRVPFAYISDMNDIFQTFYNNTGSTTSPTLQVQLWANTDPIELLGTSTQTFYPDSVRLPIRALVTALMFVAFGFALWSMRNRLFT